MEINIIVFAANIYVNNLSLPLFSLSALFFSTYWICLIYYNGYWVLVNVTGYLLNGTYTKSQAHTLLSAWLGGVYAVPFRWGMSDFNREGFIVCNVFGDIHVPCRLMTSIEDFGKESTHRSRNKWLIFPSLPNSPYFFQR